MGAIINRGYNVQASALTDAGVETDGNGNIIDPKEILKEGLINQWAVTKGHFNRLNAAQKERFEQITGIDDVDFEDDNVAAARTCIDTLQDEAAARTMLESLTALLDEAGIGQ